MFGPTSPSLVAGAAAPTSAFRVLALAAGKDARGRLRAVLPPGTEVRVARSLADLDAWLLCTGVSLVVLELAAVPVRDLEPWVAARRRTHPELPLVAYGAVTPGLPARLFDLARAGVAELVGPDDHDAVARFRALLHGAAQAGAAAAVGARLRAAGVTEDGVRLATWVVARAHDPFTVDELAEALGVPRRTLALRCEAAGLPGPGEVIGWARLVAAAHLLERPGATVEQVAAALEYPSSNALRNAFTRYMGAPATALRAEDGGALRAVVAGFAGACRRAGTVRPLGQGALRPMRRLTQTVACALTALPEPLVELLESA